MPHCVMAGFVWLIQAHSGQMMWAAGEAASEIAANSYFVYSTHLC